MASLIAIPIPIINGKVIDSLINTASTEVFVKYIILIFILESSKFIIQIISKRKLSEINLKVVRNLKKLMVSRTLNFKMSFFLNNDTGYIASRIKESENIGTIFSSNSVTSMITVFELFISLIIAIRINLFIVLITIPFIVFISYSTIKSSRKLSSLAKMQFEANANESACMFKVIDSVESTKMNDLYVEQEKLFYIRIVESMKKNWEYIKYSILFSDTIMYASKLCVLLILFVSGIFILKDRLTIGEYVAISQYIMRMLGSITMISTLPLTLKPALISIERLDEYLSECSDRDGLDFNDRINKIELKNVSFSYNNKPIINNLSYTFNTNNIYHLVGNNGAGKSTFVKVLVNLYEANSGEMLFNNVNIQDYSVKSIREHIALVTENDYYIEGTILENIIKNDGDYKTINKFILEYELKDEFEFITNDFDAFVQYNASNLSQGQRQLLSILRALLSNNDVIILDEPFSNLDDGAKNKVLKILKNINDKIVIVISHIDLDENFIEVEINDIQQLDNK